MHNHRGIQRIRNAFIIIITAEIPKQVKVTKQINKPEVSKEHCFKQFSCNSSNRFNNNNNGYLKSI